jgi:hypothetical protein
MVVEEGLVFKVLFFVRRLIIVYFLALVLDSGMDHIRNREVAHVLLDPFLSVVNIGPNDIVTLDEQYCIQAKT